MMIEAKNIQKSFGSLKVLKGIDFQAEKSEVVSIMGASGAGKSTLLQILGTLSSPDGGSLVIDGIDVLGLDRKAMSAFRNRKIGFVFQFHHLLPEFTAVENVMIPALIAGKSEKVAKSEAMSLLDTLGLSQRYSHKPSELSGGEQQRVAIARALINKPKILLADEPTGNLDNNNAWEIMKLMEEINNNGTTVVVVTHNLEIVKAMNKRVITMQKGVIVDDSDTASSIVTGDNAISRSLTERDVLKREGDYDYED